MQDLSYDFRDPVFIAPNGWRFGVQLFTFENVYGLSASHCDFRAEGNNRLTIRAGMLTWAGRQENAAGEATVTARVDAEGTLGISISARCPERIRCVKLVFHDVPSGQIQGLREARDGYMVPPNGRILRYPSGWDGLYTPLLMLQDGDKPCFYARSLDTEVREKRFALLPQGNRFTVELIHEERASEMDAAVTVPEWEIGYADSPARILERHAAHVNSAYGRLPWETRPDVPAWARGISLVATLHGQHWTGYIFNDYAAMERNLRWLAERLDGRRILAYLPGWEGRYYWQYGDYRPCPRMGGEAGFARLCETARSLGVHLMPMFGINIVNRGLANFEQWGQPALTSQASGVPGCGSVDWDGSRHYDHSNMAMLNPGAPVWQTRLARQIRDLEERFGFDGVFLDISAVWLNDPRHDTHLGVLRLAERIREGRPRLLIGGEGWYDAIGKATPLVQAGHGHGPHHWHDALPHPAFFDAFERCAAHLCLGDPGRGSTGVHELGVNADRRAPSRKGVLPTVSLVEDTLEKAPEAVEAIIEDARQYAERYL